MEGLHEYFLREDITDSPKKKGWKHWAYISVIAGGAIVLFFGTIIALALLL